MDEEEKTKEVKLETSNSKCQNCGGDLSFDPKTQKLKCAHCDSVFEFPQVQGQIKHDITKTKEDVDSHNNWASEMKTVQCKTCGAKIMLSGHAITSVCPYCGSDYVAEVETVPGLKPDVVIPFVFDAKGAVERFAAGIKHKFFAPSALKKQLPENKVTGIYVPMFTFDADTSTRYDGMLIRTETHHNGKSTTTTVKHIPISGTQNMQHRDYVIESSSKMNQKQMNALLPYDMSQSYRFTPDYLRGFDVEAYDNDLENCYANARSGMENAVEHKILSQYSYSSVEYLHCDHRYTNEFYSYRLAPIYCLDFDYKGKKYMVQINGQTGKIGSGYPKSLAKQIIFWSIIALLVAAVVVLLAWFMMKD